MLNEVYGIVEGAFHGGFGVINTEVGDLFHLFMYLSIFVIIMYGLIQAAGGGVMNIPRDLLGWIIMVASFGVVIDIFPVLSEKLMGAMWELGLGISGKAQLTDLKDFDGMIARGTYLAGHMVSGVSGWSLWEIAKNFWQFGYMGASGVILVVLYALMALRMFALMIIWIPLSMVAYIAMPFALFSPTGFIAEGAFRFVTGHALSILIFGIITSAMWGIADGLPWGPDMTLLQLVGSILVVLVMFGLAMKAPTLISNYFAGGSHAELGGSHMIRTAMMAAGAMKTMGAVMRMSGGSGGHGTTSPNPGSGSPATNPNISGGQTTPSSGFGGQLRQPRRP